MQRRNFLKLTATGTGGLLLLPDFLYSFAANDLVPKTGGCLVFLQLNGGNDGLNTFIPYDDPLYYNYRPNIAIPKKDIITSSGGMGFHPALRGLASIQQQGHLSIVQNVGYPEPNRSHFRSQEIWQTASGSTQYLNEGWLGRLLDIQCKEVVPTAAVNVDTIDNLALRGLNPNTVTVKDPSRFTADDIQNPGRLSGNPQLDFARKIAGTVTDGAAALHDAVKRSKDSSGYPQTALSRNLKWIARLIKGELNSQLYYTSQSGYDTHDGQLPIHNARLSELNDAVYAFYNDIKAAKKLDEVTLVIFSEFGRRVEDNGHGTDHGAAAPMFIIGGKNKGKIVGNNPNLAQLDEGDVRYEADFRSVYAELLQNKLHFDASLIGIKNKPLTGLFS